MERYRGVNNTISHTMQHYRRLQVGLLLNWHVLLKLSYMEDFVNIMSKNMYYKLAKDDYSYQMRPLIYDAMFKTIDEMT